MVVVSFACAIRENQLAEAEGVNNYEAFNEGTFAAASVNFFLNKPFDASQKTMRYR